MLIIDRAVEIQQNALRFALSPDAWQAFGYRRHQIAHDTLTLSSAQVGAVARQICFVN
jgi:hypothetical protein